MMLLKKNNKNIIYMQKIITFILLIMVFIFIMNYLDCPCSKEGFNTYFRQTVRPHVRNIRDPQGTVTYHFNTKFKNFGRTLGFY